MASRCTCDAQVPLCESILQGRSQGLPPNVVVTVALVVLVFVVDQDIVTVVGVFVCVFVIVVSVVAVVTEEVLLDTVVVVVTGQPRPS